ncbi:[citrate (pro-3S)-lyase] ligase [Paenibacillus macerans]|uniref:[citrate (pro-3S)-lyase] ligase n=1 Tax=Paenibacillus macerans TaxID=44252 RepID=UPI001F102B61|nr:[citrate (pro-3S)-lyase] ligase [Paenibacillus macerans]UMV45080.1 [citrate (pro-3S)-lyase] ligase [Paenibacillus macerans]
MWILEMEEQVLKLESGRDKDRLIAFLKTRGLTLDNDIQYAVAIEEEGRIVATGAFSGRVLKCIAVDEAYAGRGLSARIMNHLIREQYRRGRSRLFMFTKPKNKMIFSELGFHIVVETPTAVLLENRKDGLSRYLDEIGRECGYGDEVHVEEIHNAGAVVLNGNPFTLGHRYLIEYAAARVQKLHVFVIWEDRSVFPQEIRYRLIEEGTRHLSNVVLHQGRDYIISAATFPSYFLKKDADAAEVHAELDLTLFSRHIAPHLRITKRFVGEEPSCKVTRTYNRVMKKLLPAWGIEVEEVPRICNGQEAISASRVRELIRKGDVTAVKELVPETTYRFLQSPEAGEVIRCIRGELR